MIIGLLAAGAAAFGSLLVSGTKAPTNPAAASTGRRTVWSYIDDGRKYLLDKMPAAVTHVVQWVRNNSPLIKAAARALWAEISSVLHDRGRPSRYFAIVGDEIFRFA
jgi:hypothetical protein